MTLPKHQLILVIWLNETYILYAYSGYTKFWWRSHPISTRDKTKSLSILNHSKLKFSWFWFSGTLAFKMVRVRYRNHTKTTLHLIFSWPLFLKINAIVKFWKASAKLYVHLLKSKFICSFFSTPDYQHKGMWTMTSQILVSIIYASDP